MTDQTGLFNEGGDTEGPGRGITAVKLHQTTRQRYLNYALSVITSRALPDVRDGLKPVQRRILYGMYKDLKLRHDSRFLKSARVVGDVMGKYHPHGDSSIYDAMVRMAQDFTLRYPFVDGQGNFGSVDGDGAAAMRYTEARLRALAEDMVCEINSNTVDFRPSYDGQNQEPELLPARIPNLLANGATGIAVGMATNIPPHNLRELCDACLLLVQDPKTPTDELCKIVQGPDFPTGGELVSSHDEIVEIYETGQGAVKLRGEYMVEVINKKRCIVLTSIPYSLNKGALIEKIAQLILAKKVPQIVDIRDESTTDVRIVMELRRGDSPEAAMAYLYKHTPLQSNFNVNLTCLVPSDQPHIGTPRRLGLREVLNHFLDFRLDVVTRRLKHRYGELKKAIHRLEAFETIFDALDEILQIIRQSEGKSDAARKIMLRFDLDEEQTEAILELKLYRLAKLEILLIRRELDEKRAEMATLARQLGDINERWQLVADDLREVRETFGDDRRTRMVGPCVEENYNPEAYIIREPTFVIVTREGRIKRQKGFTQISAIRVPEGDEIANVIKTDTLHTIAFYTDRGSCYVMRVDAIPATAGHGDPVQKFFSFGDGERVVAVTSNDLIHYPQSGEPIEFPAETPQGPFVYALTTQGKVTAFPLSQLSDITTKAGRKFMSLGDGDTVQSILVGHGNELLAIATAKGRAGLFKVIEIPIKTGAVKGVIAIKLKEDDSIIDAMLTTDRSVGLNVTTSRGREVVICEQNFALQARGGKGAEVIRLGGLIANAKQAQVLIPATLEAEATPVDDTPEMPAEPEQAEIVQLLDNPENGDDK